MSQAGYTPILIYSSSTTTNAPAVGNLTNSTLGSELAINITDGKLFYKDNANAIQIIGWKVRPVSAGGTGLTSLTAGDMVYYTSGTALSTLAIGASGRYMSSSGSAPQWTAPAALTKTDDTNVTLTLGGSASTALLNAASLTLGWTGTLATTRGGTGLSSFTANGVMYASSTSALATGTALTFDGSQLSVLRASTSTALFDDAEIRAINTGTATINQRVDIAMRWQDGTYNGTGGIGMVRESATARSGTLTFYPIDSSGNALATLRAFSSGGVSIGNTTDSGVGVLNTNSLIENTGQAWTAYTPTISVDAGTIGTPTIVLARYRILGKTLFLQLNVTVSITSGAPSEIRCTLPNGRISPNTSMYTTFWVTNNSLSRPGLLRQTSNNYGVQLLDPVSSYIWAGSCAFYGSVVLELT